MRTIQLIRKNDTFCWIIDPAPPPIIPKRAGFHHIGLSACHYLLQLITFCAGNLLLVEYWSRTCACRHSASAILYSFARTASGG
jgi:hypothetical protein